MKKEPIKKKPVKKKVTKKVAEKVTKKPVKRTPPKRGLAGRTSNSIKKSILKSLESTMGVVTTACQLARVSRKTYYQYLKEDDKFREATEDIQNIALDFGESKLYKAISNDNLTAVIFYLKTKGRERGFNENIAISSNVKTVGHITQGAPINLDTWEALAEKSLASQNEALDQLLKARITE